MSLIDIQPYPNKSDYSEYLATNMAVVNCQLLEDGRIVEITTNSIVDPVTYNVVDSEKVATFITKEMALSRQVSSLWNYVNCSDEPSSKNEFTDKEKCLNAATAWGVIEEHLLFHDGENGSSIKEQDLEDFLNYDL